jgi:hypothetical protein
VIAQARYVLSLINRDVAAGYLRVPRSNPGAAADSLRAAIDWICHAHDAAGDGGVSRSYSLGFHPLIGGRGWLPSYPETTGYIIPTMFDFARRSGRDDVFHRAVRMADWETDIQLPSGAVRGGTIVEREAPAVFNTGQVLFGWVRAFEETGNARYLEAASKAGDYLVSVQDPDGSWRKDLGGFAASDAATVYNARTAWGLLVLASATGEARYREGAIRNIEYALTEQTPNGWFRHNCLYDTTRPLLHTIAYALRGVLEVGMAIGEPRFVSAARRGADELLARQREDGSLLARYDQRWEPTVGYCCLTGVAQMGTVWARLHDATGDERYARGLHNANLFLRRVQWLGTGNPGLDGGISGSYPLHGRYNRFQIPNWAVKFFADALMFEESIDKAAPRPSCRLDSPKP